MHVPPSVKEPAEAVQELPERNAVAWAEKRIGNRTRQFEVVPRYWTQTNPPYEVDFLIQRENDIFPVEVKSVANTSSKSLKKFKELFPDQVKLRVRFSLDNLRLDGGCAEYSAVYGRPGGPADWIGTETTKQKQIGK